MRTCHPFGIFLALTVAASSPLRGQSLEVVGPESAGFSKQRLTRVSDFVAREMDRKQIAGAVTLVARDRNVVHYEAAGLADVAGGRPIAKDSIFRIMSMTKPIVSLGVLMLYEEGRFLLDDPVTRFLPELADLRVVTDNATVDDLETVPAERDITILDLLTHRAGFVYGFINQGPVGELYRRENLELWRKSSQKLVERLAELPLARQPGRVHEYSLATDVLGRMVEVVSGQRLDSFLEERILSPLGMTDTYFDLPAKKAGRLVTLYDVSEEGQMKPVETQESGPREFYSGGGGLVSTAPDYFRFLSLLLNGGTLDGVRLVSPKTIELMTQDHVGHEVGIHPGYGFGLGVAVRTEPDHGVVIGSVGEYTWGGIHNTVFWVDPRERLVLIFMTNTTPFDLDQRWYFKTAVYQALVR